MSVPKYGAGVVPETPYILATIMVNKSLQLATYFVFLQLFSVAPTLIGGIVVYYNTVHPFGTCAACISLLLLRGENALLYYTTPHNTCLQ